MAGATALMFAAKSNPNPDVIIALLDANADIRIKTNTGKTAYDLGKENPALVGSAVLDLLKV
jgi:ankyrin repeat protein